MSEQRSVLGSKIFAPKTSTKRNPKEPPAPPWDKNLSAAIKGVIKRLDEKEKVPAVVMARELLKYRTVYAQNKGGKKLKLLNEYLTGNADTLSTKQTPKWWLDDVKHLYIDDISFHGKLLLIGLAMLDETLKSLLVTDGFLDQLIPEVKENVVTLLSASGKKKFDELIFDKNPNENDQLENSDDNPLIGKEDDFLDRYYFAEFIVKLLSQTSLAHGAFAVHLYAPWGAGKTSFMNFMKNAFQADKTHDGQIQWYCVDFNAWQNQSMAYPWWTFMNNIFFELKSYLPLRFKLKERFWRFKALRLHQTFALLVIAYLLYLYGENKQQGNDKWLENISKFLGALVAIWGVSISLSQSLFIKSKRAVQDFLESKDNPMAEFKSKFKKFVTALKPGKIVIFIDDLDRCKSNYVVELLENIQTIFKEANVIFIIAADKKWLHASYEVEYDKIKNFVNVEGKAIGPLFIEKMFQLSIAVPGVPELIKEKCWSAMLKIKMEEKDDKTQKKRLGEEVTEKQSFDEKHQKNLKSLESLSDQITLKQTEHFLKPYGRFLDVNPRNMKRLLNNYLVNKAASLISHIDIPRHQLILYTILSIQWPDLTEYLLQNPEMLNSGENIPDNIAFLLKQTEIKAVINGKGFENKGFEEKLSVITLQRCGVLFSFVGYSTDIFNEPELTKQP